jgi:oxygen-dependent protoporphyrinogen oxidase
VHTGVEVTALDRDDAWQVRTTSGVFTADVVCLAVPATIAAGLLRTFASPEAHTAAGLLGELPTTEDVRLVSLLVEDRSLTRAGAPVGSGVLVADGTVRAKAMTHASAKWAWLAEQLPADHHVLRLSYGGTHDPDRSDGADDAGLVTVALADASRLLDGATEGLALRASVVTRWRGALSRPVVGRSERLATIDEQLRDLPSLALTGSAVAGNGLAGVVGRSTHEARRIH